VEFSSVPGAPSAEFAKTALNATPQAATAGTIWSKKDVRTFLRVASLLFGGMILGALLTFAWFFSQAKYRRASNGASIRMSTAECEFRRLVGLSREDHFNPRM